MTWIYLSKLRLSECENLLKNFKSWDFNFFLFCMSAVGIGKINVFNQEKGWKE